MNSREDNASTNERKFSSIGWKVIEKSKIPLIRGQKLPFLENKYIQFKEINQTTDSLNAIVNSSNLSRSAIAFWNTLEHGKCGHIFLGIGTSSKNEGVILGVNLKKEEIDLLPDAICKRLQENIQPVPTRDDYNVDIIPIREKDGSISGEWHVVVMTLKYINSSLFRTTDSQYWARQPSGIYRISIDSVNDFLLLRNRASKLGFVEALTVVNELSFTQEKEFPQFSIKKEYWKQGARFPGTVNKALSIECQISAGKPLVENITSLQIMRKITALLNTMKPGECSCLLFGIDQSIIKGIKLTEIDCDLVSSEIWGKLKEFKPAFIGYGYDLDFIPINEEVMPEKAEIAKSYVIALKFTYSGSALYFVRKLINHCWIKDNENPLKKIEGDDFHELIAKRRQMEIDCEISLRQKNVAPHQILAYRDNNLFHPVRSTEHGFTTGALSLEKILLATRGILNKEFPLIITELKNHFKGSGHPNHAEEQSEELLANWDKADPITKIKLLFLLKLPSISNVIFQEGGAVSLILNGDDNNRCWRKIRKDNPIKDQLEKFANTITIANNSIPQEDKNKMSNSF